MTEQASPSASPEDAPKSPGEERQAPLPAPQAETAPSPQVPAADPYRPSYPFLVGVSLASLIADLGTKWWAKGRLEDPKTWADRRVEVIKGYFSFIFAKNRGGAWGLLQDEPESIRRPFFLGISVLAIVFIVSLYRKLTPEQWALKWGLPLVLGGALGNLVNRIQYNYVVDFIDFSYKGHHWPTFNVADIAIVVGVGLMAVDMFTPRRAVATVAPAPTTDAARDPAPVPPPPAADPSEPRP